jgi:glycosyltransferase involved in cell wall biosynthesis
VCDNGSTDASVAIAERMGARVVHEPRRGYGNAHLTGFAAARGKYLLSLA